MINAPAPIAPELAYKEEQHSKERQRELRIAKVIMSYLDLSYPPPCNFFCLSEERGRGGGHNVALLFLASPTFILITVLRIQLILMRIRVRIRIRILVSYLKEALD